MTVTQTGPGAAPGALARVLLRAKDADALLQIALRSRHDAAVGALVDAAGFGREPLAVLERVLAGEPVPERVLVPGRTLPATLALANAWAGMERDEREKQAAVQLFVRVWEQAGASALTARDQRNLVQAAFLTGDLDLVRRGLAGLPRITPAVAGGLRADLLNPLHGGPGTADAWRAWEEAFGERFREKGLTAPSVDPAADPLFDGLTLELDHWVDGPLVTVVVPAFRPDEGLVTSVLSIVRQTHGPLEVLLVDDCSGPGFEDVFARAEALDERVRLIRQPVNGGSYLARNTALARARGELVTIQDADDWSHPERIARQVALMHEQPQAAGSRSAAIRCRPDLTRQWFGYSPERMNASSLMVRRDLLEQVGGFDPIRKGADSELHERLALLGGVVDLPEPLAVTRLAAGSLSRADFSYGRHSPERVLFRSAFRHWHAALGDHARQRVERVGQRPYPVPRSFVRGLPHAEVPRTAYPLVLLLDQADPVPAAAEPALTELLAGGAAVLGREDLTRAGAVVGDWSGRLLDAAREGGTDLLTDGDEVHAETLLVLEPSLLALPALPMPRLTAGRVVVAAVPPGPGEPPRDLESAGETVRQVWGTAPLWCARSADEQRTWRDDGWELPLVTEVVGAGPAV